MNKKIKLSLMGTLIAGSALAVTMPIVSCSAAAKVELTGTATNGQTLSLAIDKAILNGTAAATTASANFAAQDASFQELLSGKGAAWDSMQVWAKANYVALYTDVKNSEGTVVEGNDWFESLTFTATDVTAITASLDISTIKFTTTVNFKGDYTITANTFTAPLIGTAKAT